MVRSNHAPPIDNLVREACQGTSTRLEELLVRRGGLPGPRPNLKLASTVASALVAGGADGECVLARMRALDEREAPAGSAFPILPIVGVLGLGIAAAKAPAPATRERLDALRSHAQDGRREVRDAVVEALSIALRARPTETLEGLADWTQGYLEAEQMLRVLSDRSLVQQLDDPTPCLARLQEAFALAAGAARAHQRSQGYRALLRTLGTAVATLGKRFPHPVTGWIREHAEVASEDLLAALNDGLGKLRASGLREGDAQSVQQALDAAVPPPRDPRWDVGPTRSRGKKGRRKPRS